MLILAAAIGATLAGAPMTSAQAPSQPLYKDASQPVARRIDDLLARMTLEEKVAQLVTVWEHKDRIQSPAGQFSADKASRAFPHGLGQIARPSDKRGVTVANTGAAGAAEGLNRDARDTAEYVNAAQRWATRQTRLGIPILMHEEALHGYVARGATSFPQSIALASTWDPKLVERVLSVAAREMRARGATLALAPVVDVARDPRWGRIEETYGEDPYLVSEMGLAAIRGFQGRSLPLAPDKVMVTLKHMTGHGQPENGTNVGPAQISERALRENFFPPFERAVKELNVRSVMASYNEIDGVPSHANPWLLNDVLRGEWGFQGAVVSDYFAIAQMADVHRMFGNVSEAAERAIKSGVDAETPDDDAYKHLAELVRSGRVPQALVDQSVRRVLRLKFEAGLFENPFADAATAEARTATPDAVALAREAARKAIVLLKNDGALLPLDAGRLMTARIEQETKLDSAVHATLTLFSAAARAGDNAGLVVFGRRIKSYLPPGRGRLRGRGGDPGGSSAKQARAGEHPLGGAAGLGGEHGADAGAFLREPDVVGVLAVPRLRVPRLRRDAFQPGGAG
jgi:beta-glucosidase